MILQRKSEFDRLISMLGLTVDPWVRDCAHYLESQGQKFLVHFGTDDAIEKAMDIMPTIDWIQ